MKILYSSFTLGLLIGFINIAAAAQQISCTSEAGKVTAVTNPSGHVITTKYQTDNPNLQTLLSTTIRAQPGCIVAHLSGLTRITDNYVVFQVRINGVPMKGQLGGIGNVLTPGVFVSIDSGNPPYEDEQYIDPTKVVSYNFFERVPGGIYHVEVMGAAGSGIDPNNPPSVNALVLTLTYR